MVLQKQEMEEQVHQIQLQEVQLQEEAEEVVDLMITIQEVNRQELEDLAEVVPEAVTGVKDGTNEEGIPVYQAVDAARLIPILVSAVQELARRVAVLEARA